MTAALSKYPRGAERKWRHDSEFGDGPRTSLNRDQRGIIRAKLGIARRRYWITPTHELVGQEMLQLIGQDGRLDPSQATLARRAGCCPRTVSTALRRFRNLGLLDWVRRLVRQGRHIWQTSNAYRFHPNAVIPQAAPPALRLQHGGAGSRGCFRIAGDRRHQGGRAALRPPASAAGVGRAEAMATGGEDRPEALSALARVALDRTAAITAEWRARHR